MLRVKMCKNQSYDNDTANLYLSDLMSHKVRKN